eukprot:gnl/TRDRNA2_/TRDRNA2_117178_c0_seq1.p3 gnl/TRDRNA2_/TRDRNA2_117178_c0~~gnl/TRDRNA2_/TRDRNA2_117178_c0_seq1.p3  ORF type:complete len:101 (-),score=12.61 gnl/TRDRNA2_/TRDRNA2_117178_c0_seq1:340-642(-)
MKCWGIACLKATLDGPTMITLMSNSVRIAHEGFVAKEALRKVRRLLHCPHTSPLRSIGSAHKCHDDTIPAQSCCECDIRVSSQSMQMSPAAEDHNTGNVD